MSAKISISLPEALKATLDRYAQEHNLSASQVIQKALEGLFSGAPAPPPPPAPPPGPPPDDSKLLQCLLRDLANIQRYLSALGANHEQLRSSVCLMAPFVPIPEGIGLPMPDAMPTAPWERG